LIGQDDPNARPVGPWRSGGHQLGPGSGVLRFDVADMNRVISGSAASADLYRRLLDDQGHPADWQVLTMS
jgi:hypothetical protein